MRGSERSAVELMIEAAHAAIADAGLAPRDIDGVIPPPIHTFSEELAVNLGIERMNYAATVMMGGASATAALQSAAMAVASGVAKNVLIVFGWNGYSDFRPGARRAALGANPMTHTIRDFYLPAGVTRPAQMYAWLAMRHMKLYGVTAESMGAVAVACRKHAQHNERALMRGKPLTMEPTSRRAGSPNRSASSTAASRPTAPPH